MTSKPDVQLFEKNGTWRKPPGAVRVEVTLKGGTGRPGYPFGAGGRGGNPTITWGGGAEGGGGGHPVMARGGDGGSGVISAERGVPIPGEEGETVTQSLAAADFPDEVEVTVGQVGGYAQIITYFADDAPPDLTYLDTLESVILQPPPRPIGFRLTPDGERY